MKQTLKHANVINKLVILFLFVNKGRESQRSEINKVISVARWNYVSLFKYTEHNNSSKNGLNNRTYYLTLT